MRDKFIEISLNDLIAKDILYQHDKGQVVRFVEEIGDGTLVLFNNSNVKEDAVPRYVENCSVEIPDRLLETEGSLVVTVKLVDLNSETTQKVIKIKIKSGSKQNEEIEPENQQTFIEQIQDIMTTTKSIAEDVQERADNGEFNGADGYTPVKGKDYFTDAEVNQIKNDTREQVVTEINPSLENNLKSAKDYTDNAIIRDFKDITYDETTATFIFTRHDDTTFTVDLPIEQTVKDGRYDDETAELVLVLVSGQEIRIPVSGLIDDYTGVDSATIQVVISADNKITCNIIGGTISKTLLTTELQEEIDGKVNRSEMSNLVQEVCGKLSELATTDKESYVGAINELKGDLDHNKEAIEELNDKKITKFYANNLGETTLKDSDNGKFQDMMIYGKSEQFSTQGYNLLDLSEIKNTTQTKNGITIKVNEDCSINVEGTPTEYVSFVLSNFTLKPGTYYLPKISKDYFLQMIGSNSNYRSGQTFTLDEDKTVNLYFVVMSTSSTINSGTKIYPMILNGNIYSETNVPQYEPYTGGIPSPNPGYPQKIQGVVNPTITVSGAQLQSKGGDNYKNNGITANYVNETEITIKGTATAKCSPGFCLVNLKENTTYTLSLYGIDFTKINVVLSYLGNLSNVSKTFNSGLYTKRWINFAIEEGTTVDCTFKLMLNEGSIALPYEPYKEQVATLPYELNAIPVTDGGNVTIDGQQYLADFVDVERKKLVRMVERVRINDLYNSVNCVSRYTVHDNTQLFRLSNNNYKKLGNLLSNMLLYEPNLWRSEIEGIKMIENSIDFRLSNERLGVTAEATANEALTALKTWLENNNLVFLAELINPIEIDLTDEEVQAFKQLSTYYPHTNVTVKSEQLDGYTTFNYPISMANGWNYVKEQLGDTREYIYDMELQSAEAYVNSEYAVALSELEV